VNGVLDTLQQKSKTEQRVSSAYHPEINGLVERFNQILQNMLAKVCPDENDWDLYLVTFSKAHEPVYLGMICRRHSLFCFRLLL
jgi:hypothetical protein